MRSPPRLPPGSIRSSRRSSSRRSCGRFDLLRGPRERRRPRVSAASSRSRRRRRADGGVAPAAAPRAPGVAGRESRHRSAGARYGTRRLVRVARHAFHVRRAACCVARRPYGAREVWRALPVARTGVLGSVLTLAQWHRRAPHGATIRSRSPAISCRLLRCSCSRPRPAPSSSHAGSQPPGGTRAMRRRSSSRSRPPRRSRSTRRSSTLERHPNAQTLHLVYHVDFRPGAEPVSSLHGEDPAVSLLGTPGRGAPRQPADRRGAVLLRELRLGRPAMGAHERPDGDPRLPHGTLRRSTPRRGAALARLPLRERGPPRGRGGARRAPHRLGRVAEAVRADGTGAPGGDRPGHRPLRGSAAERGSGRPRTRTTSSSRSACRHPRNPA